ncbi:class I histocompatibility antigen, F10 alpha chain-like isoform X2 [Alosa sapidissima]|uniref:class I histocompatibility antigen, F10 alpha chain-like isoform X2 n=1 Tax=Alosa sapidissima TaxID=34773 RepID=UPI001C09E9CB|nr:class I histocompatibility antigen, F10 alpha chain-like isoform X2 [Alosa sapidissima]
MFVVGVGLLLGLCCFHQASGAIHSLQYFYTATSEIPNLPDFVAVAMVDSVQFVHYDSKSKEAVPKRDWINKHVAPQYWKRETDIFLAASQTFKENIDTLKQRFNQTGGVHTYQLMYGCQWDETGYVNGYRQYGYDGEDFIFLELKEMRWIAPSKESVITKNKWDPFKPRNHYLKDYYSKTCIEWGKKYVQYGSSSLDRKVHPEVTLIQKDSGVACHATGFYPDQVMITWKRDGEEMQEDVDVGETLPNEDGTFQKRAVLAVSPEERKKGQYTCEVAHKSGPPTFKTLIVEDGNILGIIIGCVVAAAVVIGVIVAIVMKKKKGYKKAEQSDSESDHSNGART